MFRHTRIGNLCLFVADLDRTEAFYRDILGLDVQRMADPTGDWLTAPTAGGITLIFFTGEGAAGASPIPVFELAEGGIDSLVAALAAAGVPIVDAPAAAPGGLSAEFADPDGHVLSVYQTADLPRSR